MDKTIDDVRKIVQNVKNVFQTEHEVKKITFGTMMQKIKQASLLQMKQHFIIILSHQILKNHIN